MSEQHDLAHEFPEFVEVIHTLKMADTHFQRLMAEYHQLDKIIHRMDANIEPASDAHMETLKKRRLELKDELYQMMRSKKQAC